MNNNDTIQNNIIISNMSAVFGVSYNAMNDNKQDITLRQTNTEVSNFANNNINPIIGDNLVISKIYIIVNDIDKVNWKIGKLKSNSGPIYKFDILSDVPISIDNVVDLNQNKIYLLDTLIDAFKQHASVTKTRYLIAKICALSSPQLSPLGQILREQFNFEHFPENQSQDLRVDLAFEKEGGGIEEENGGGSRNKNSSKKTKHNRNRKHQKKRKTKSNKTKKNKTKRVKMLFRIR